MSLLLIDSIREKVDRHSPMRPPVRPNTRQAAVSMVLKPRGEETSALFILRAEVDNDPWSGHMAFPGGRHEPGDATLRRTAERETLEEIGLDLSGQASFIGQLDPVRANPRGRNLDMVVTPFVYELKDQACSFSPNHEVADILWGSLNDMHTGRSHDMGKFPTGAWPGYRVGEEIVWGLTYRMLDQFFGLLDPDWTPR